MGWHNVQKLLEQSAEHSTLIGKFWVTSFFILRLLLIGAIGGTIWGDSQGNFVCNTKSPGCKNVCFNEYSPIALNRFWFLQILCVALPSIIFIVYTAHKMARVNQAVVARKAQEALAKKERKKRRQEAREEDRRRILESGGDPSKVEHLPSDSDDDNPDDDKIVATKLSHDAPSKLFIAYYLVVLSRMLIEIAFMIAQYHVYTFKFQMPELFQCQHWPCPNVVDCFVSRPKEKTIFICILWASSCIMVILNLLELFHISKNLPKAWRERDDDITKHVDEGPSFGPVTTRQWAPGVGYIERGPTGYPDAVGLPMLYMPGRGGPRRNRRNRRRY